jgi:hypothetical protein
VLAWVGVSVYNRGMRYGRYGDYQLHAITAYTVYYNCHSCASVTAVPIPTRTHNYGSALPVPKVGRIKDSEYIGHYYLCAPCHKQARKHEAAH